MTDVKTVLTNTIEIEDPEDENIKYEFKVPGVKDQMALGMRARAIRRENDPTGSGDLRGLDSETALLAWSLGAFELLLKSSGAVWPFSEGKDKKPTVDYKKFPDDKYDTVLHIGVRLDREIARFRKGWVANWKPTGGEAMDGIEDTGA